MNACSLGRRAAWQMTCLSVCSLGMVGILGSFAHAQQPLLGVGLKEDQGAVVTHVVPDSPAEAVGLQVGDKILEVAGEAVPDVTGLIKLIHSRKVGDRVQLKIQRGDEILEPTVTLAAGRRRYGIQGAEAPEIRIEQWGGLPEGKTDLTLAELKDKTVYIFCFQTWCPGCHRHGFPTLKKVHEKFASDPSVAILAIQTVFEGFDTNTFEQGQRALKKFELDIPLGQDGSREQPSTFMRDYRTGGTPWTVVIGPDGKVQFDGYELEADKAIRMIQRLQEK